MAESRAGLLGLAIGGGLGALALIAVVVLALRGCSGSEPAAAAARTSAGAEVAKDGMHARGTDELRALGCTNALVMDMQRALGDAGVRHGEPRYIVTCDVASGPTPPCDKAASTYFAAVAGGADGAVNVRVSLQGTPRPVCSHLYLPSGADQGDYPRVR